MATKIQKDTISKQFEPVIEVLKKNISPIPEPQQFNHCVGIVSNWRGNYFYIKQKYKTPENKYFEVGLARLTFHGTNSFSLAYFRHTGKWFPLPMYEAITLEEAQKAISEEQIFQVA